MVEHAETLPHAHEEPQGHGKGIRHELMELLTAVILATAGALSAWAGFQASLYDGQQSASYAEAESARTVAAQASTLAGQLAQLDAAVFLSWVTARTAHNTELDAFLQQRFRPEFKPVFDEWIALDPWHNAAAPSTPFQMPDYHSKMFGESRALAAKAHALQQTGNEANKTSDLYGRATVIFALALFFAGIAGVFKHMSVRAGVVVLAAALVVLGLTVMVSLPRALPG